MLLGRPDFLKNILYSLQVPGYMGLLTCLVALVFGEHLSLIPFFGTALITLGPSWLLIRRLAEKGEGRIKKTMSLIALSYGVISLIGAVPIYTMALLYTEQGDASGNLMNLNSFINALFESFAGFTSSGLTMLNNPADIPHSLQFWRSLSQWVGGLGIFILATFIFSPHEKGVKSLIKTEVGNIYREEKTPNRIRQIWIIYIGFTLLGFFLFLLADQTVWVSLNHALTAVSTGGFNVTNDSFRYQPLDSKIYSMLLMTLGALGFSMYWDLFWNRNLKAVVRYKENIWFLILLLSGVVLLAAESMFSNDAPGLVDNVYQWISALTTSGFQTVKIEQWESWKILVLSMAMLIGGVGGSTAGGIKIRRMVFLYYTLRYNLNGRSDEKDRDAVIQCGEGDTMEAAFANFITFLGVWLAVMLISVLLVSLVVGDNYSVNQILFEVISAQSNVGLSAGITSADMHWLLKTDFMLLMWMGRLELVAVVIMVRNWIPSSS